MATSSNREAVFRLTVDGSDLKRGLEEANKQIDEFVGKAGSMAKAIKTMAPAQQAAARSAVGAVAAASGLTISQSRTPLMAAYATGLSVTGGDQGAALDYMRARAEQLAASQRESLRISAQQAAVQTEILRTGGMQVGVNRTNTNEVRNQAAAQQSILQSLRETLTLGKAYAAFQMGRQVAGAAYSSTLGLGDEYNRLEMRLSSLPDGPSAARDAMGSLLEITQKTGVSLKETVPLYQALVRTAKDLGLSKNDAEKLTLTIQQLGIISGTSTEAMKFGLRQLTQAMAMGVVHAEEFNSMIENMPELVQRVADVLTKGSTTALRQMVINQQLLSSELARALKEIQVDTENTYMPLANAFTAVWEKAKAISDEIFGWSDKADALSRALRRVADAMPTPRNMESVDQQIARIKTEQAIREQGGIARFWSRLTNKTDLSSVGDVALQAALENRESEKLVASFAAAKPIQQFNAASKSLANLGQSMAFPLFRAKDVPGAAGLTPADLRLADLSRGTDVTGSRYGEYLSRQGKLDEIQRAYQAEWEATQKIADANGRAAEQKKVEFETQQKLLSFIAETEEFTKKANDETAKKIEHEANEGKRKEQAAKELKRHTEDTAAAEMHLAMKQAERAGNTKEEARLRGEIVRLEALHGQHLADMTPEMRAQFELAAKQKGQVAEREVLEKRAYENSKAAAREAERAAEAESRRQERFRDWADRMRSDIESIKADRAALGEDPVNRAVNRYLQGGSEAGGRALSGRELAEAEVLARTKALEERKTEIHRRAKEATDQYDSKSRYETAMRELQEMEATGRLSAKARLEIEKQAMDEMLRESESWVDGMQLAYREYTDSALQASKLAHDAFLRTFSSLEDSLVEFITTGKVQVRDFVTSMLAELTRLTVRKTITEPLSGFFSNMLLSSFGGGSAVGGYDFDGGLGDVIDGILGSAKGNAFSGGKILPFARGGVISKATLTPMALMGEAGPEAVMPLSRGADGRLGVKAAGTSPNVTVNVIQSQDQAGTTQTTTDSGGNSLIEVFVAQIESSMARRLATGQGTLDQAMRSAYGVRRRGN